MKRAAPLRQTSLVAQYEQGRAVSTNITDDQIQQLAATARPFSLALLSWGPERYRDGADAIELEHQSVAEKVDAAFHPYWGSLLKEAGDRSNFGVQVATYADIYMRSVSSLRHYSPLQHFRSPRDLMPHEL